MIGYVISLMLYGCYACVFTTTLWVYRPSMASRFDFVRCVVMLLFALSTAQEVIAIVHNWKSWIGHQDPAAFGHADAAKDLLFYIQGLTEDVLVVWRLYIIWSRSVRVMILPLVALAAYIAVTADLCFQVFQGGTGPQDADKYTKMTYASTGLALFLNVYTTSLIIGRLWWTGDRCNVSATGLRTGMSRLSEPSWRAGRCVRRRYWHSPLYPRTPHPRPW